VLPNAPIDETTGLPVPTIAVATDGGVSVIRDHGPVYDITTTVGSNNQANHITFNEEKTKLSWLTRNGAIYALVTDVPDTDITARQSDDVVISLHTSYTPGTGYDIKIINGSNYNDLIHSRDNILAFAAGGSNSGLQLVDYDYENLSGDNQGKVCQVTTSFNTGWQYGDIKGAFLSDTDTTNVTGSQLVTNGDFSSALGSTWTAEAGGTTIAINSGVLDVSRSGSGSLGQMSAYQQVTGLTVGEIYVLTGEVTAMSHEASIGISTNLTGGGYDVNSNTEGYYLSDNWTSSNGISSPGTITVTFEAAETSYYVGLGARTSTTATASFDNISLRKAEYDRSVNQKGLQVFGTVTKSAVATGAELVAYSGFSSSNLLYQSYNSDLDPGTGDYSFMLWFKCPAVSGEQMIMRRFSNVSVTGGMMMRVVSSTSVLQWYVRDTSSTATTINSPSAIDDGVWHCAVGTRQGSTANLYLDGALVTTQTCSANSHDPGTTANLVIGAEESVGSPGTFQNPAASCSLALIRYSLSAPSPEQIKKMYEDEKVLFQENAKATLYGSSDAVTALAFDDDTDLLHAGTGDGRSDFQGLRRINNTTTAVTTAITAQNEFIIEQ